MDFKARDNLLEGFFRGVFEDLLILGFANRRNVFRLYDSLDTPVGEHRIPLYGPVLERFFLSENGELHGWSIWTCNQF
jgi:hypothetical protein